MNFDDLSFSDPIIVSSIIIMSISVLLPCLIWFLKNYFRIVLKKNYEYFNLSIKWILLFCLIIFITSIILLALKLNGVV
ncbi:MAG: hypothetical protein ACRCRZ_02945 [Metamycoplasmataceae bacterium]